MKKDRLSKWEKMILVPTLLAGENKERLEIISEIQSKALKDNPHEDVRMTNFGITQSCRELIFDIKDGLPIFHCIMHAFNTDYMSIKIEHVMDIIIAEDQTTYEITEDVCNTLAIANAVGVPVYPNNEFVAPQLSRYHRQMLIEGFTAPNDKGGRDRLHLKNSLAKRLDNPNIIRMLDPTEAISPADLLLIKESVAHELDELSGARVIIEGIKLAITELSVLLEQPKRNENAVQACLTANPILFGPEYKQIIPKHRFGSEFELDYALLRHSGAIDLVEIESPNLNLFNKKGDPSSYLIHAEQQVLDWLSWVESNNPYAQKSLPGLSTPMGFVIIGRSHTLSDKEIIKLKARNSLFQGRLNILTYDDLLERSRQILRIMKSAGAALHKA